MYAFIHDVTVLRMREFVFEINLDWEYCVVVT